MTNTNKELIKTILRIKYTKENPEYIYLSPELYHLLQPNMINWKENFPGAIYYHQSLCGLFVIVDKDLKGESFIIK